MVSTFQFKKREAERPVTAREETHMKQNGAEKVNIRQNYWRMLNKFWQ